MNKTLFTSITENTIENIEMAIITTVQSWSWAIDEMHPIEREQLLSDLQTFGTVVATKAAKLFFLGAELPTYLDAIKDASGGSVLIDRILATIGHALKSQKEETPETPEAA
jgi:hypothetical protein